MRHNLIVRLDVIFIYRLWAKIREKKNWCRAYRLPSVLAFELYFKNKVFNYQYLVYNYKHF